MRNTHLILKFIPGAQLCTLIPHWNTLCLLWSSLKWNQFYQFKGLNSVAGNDLTIEGLLLHLVCNGWEHGKHFFKFIIQNEIAYQDDLYDENKLPAQILSTHVQSYAYVTYSHLYGLLLGKNIHSNKSLQVPHTRLNLSQQQQNINQKINQAIQQSSLCHDCVTCIYQLDHWQQITIVWSPWS